MSISDIKYACDMIPLKLYIIIQLPLDCDIQDIIKKTLYNCSFDVIKAPPIECLIESGIGVYWMPETMFYNNYGYRFSQDLLDIYNVDSIYEGCSGGTFTYLIHHYRIRASVIGEMYYVAKTHDSLIRYLI